MVEPKWRQHTITPSWECWVLNDTHGRTWKLLRHVGKRYWHAFVDGRRVFAMAGKRPQYWAHLDRAKAQIEQYAVGGAWIGS